MFLFARNRILISFLDNTNSEMTTLAWRPDHINYAILDSMDAAVRYRTAHQVQQGAPICVPGEPPGVSPYFQPGIRGGYRKEIREGYFL